MATKAGDMILTASAPALAQWLPADGRYVYGYQQTIIPARPHTGVSQGWVRDYERNVSGWARTRGIGGWMMGLPLAPTFSVSVADDSGDATVPTNTVQKPPAGTK
jgi:hypothetical protein